MIIEFFPSSCSLARHLFAMAGHSKWANIKHTKARMDAKRSKVYAKIAREITIAAKLAGGDPDMNPRLRLAVLNGRGANMPADNIQRAICARHGRWRRGEFRGVDVRDLWPARRGDFMRGFHG